MRKFFKKVLFVFLSLFLIVNYFGASYVQAASVETEPAGTYIGDHLYTVSNDNGNITVKEYYKGEIVSITKSSVNSDIIIRKTGNVSTNYCKTNLVETTSISNVNLLSAQSATFKDYGKYKLKGLLMGDLKNYYALLKYYVSKKDYTSFNVAAKANTAVSLIISDVATIICSFATQGEDFAAALVKSIVSGSGVSTASGKILSSIYEPVAAKTTFYNVKFTNTKGVSNGRIYTGKRHKIITKDSDYYNETFYEGVTPQKYKSFGRTAFTDSCASGSYYGYVSFTKY